MSCVWWALFFVHDGNLSGIFETEDGCQVSIRRVFLLVRCYAILGGGVSKLVSAVFDVGSSSLRQALPDFHEGSVFGSLFMISSPALTAKRHCVF